MMAKSTGLTREAAFLRLLAAHPGEAAYVNAWRHYQVHDRPDDVYKAQQAAFRQREPAVAKTADDYVPDPWDFAAEAWLSGGGSSVLP